MTKSKHASPLVAVLPFLLLLSACVMDAPLPQDYYAGTGKIAGGNPPSTPVVTFDKSQLRIDFTASIDPDTGAEVSKYFLYYYNGVPQTFYQVRDIDTTLNSPSVRTLTLNTPSDGKHTFVITGYDGYRESAINDNNRIIFDWP